MATLIAQPECYIGLMSGTSTDGVDGVLADFTAPGGIRTLSAASLPMPQALRNEFLALNSPGANELDRAARAAVALAHLYSNVVDRLLDEAGLARDQVQAIGAHGQTVRHAPESAYSIQLNAPAHLAELTGIDVVADFRSRDIAAGGQGAPLVPAFHAAWFGLDTPRTILNLGGIANVTILNETVLGFDTGPANMLMDLWAQQHLGQAYDQDGRWAAQGRSNPALLERMLSDPWFDRPPPKSTGRDYFNETWLQDMLSAMPEGLGLAPTDVMATLMELTVQSIARAVLEHASGTREVLACGGGALNSRLMDALARALPCPLYSTDRAGMPVQTVEALAFAWLAYAHVHRIPASLPAVTGARHPSVAGCLYPG
ncbi:MAG: anhydro-N-acetylmuramic acid kinase [Alcaligenaceae bacterium]|nr:anhydro-N-acetylmuramic acid kinase [Alcaligenaceae bacterium]